MVAAYFVAYFVVRIGGHLVGIEEALIDNLVVNTESLTVDTGSLVVNTESLTVDTENLTVDTGVDKKTYVRILSLSCRMCQSWQYYHGSLFQKKPIRTIGFLYYLFYDLLSISHEASNIMYIVCLYAICIIIFFLIQQYKMVSDGDCLSLSVNLLIR